MAGGRGPAPVLAGLVFLKVKIKVHFYKKQVINKRSDVNFGFFRLLILSNNRLKKHIIFGKPWFFILIPKLKYSHTK